MAHIDYVEYLQGMIEFAGAVQFLDRKNRSAWEKLLGLDRLENGLELYWSLPEDEIVDLKHQKYCRDLKTGCTEREVNLIAELERSYFALAKSIERALDQPSKRRPGELTKRQYKIIMNELARVLGDIEYCLGKLLQITEPWYWHHEPDEFEFVEADTDVCTDEMDTSYRENDEN